MSDRDRAELAKRLRDVANSFACGDYTAMDLEDNEIPIHKLLHETADELDRASADYLIWSNEHHAWWRRASQGYTADVTAAGRYSRKEAITICKNARNGYRKNEIPTEIPISVDDLAAMDSRLVAICNAGGE